MSDSCSKQLLEKRISYYRDLAIEFSRKAENIEQQEILRKREYNNLLFIKDILKKGPNEIKKEKTKYIKKGFFQSIILSIFLFLFQSTIELELIEMFLSLLATCSTMAGINSFYFYKFNLPTIKIIKNNTLKIVECNIEILQDEINSMISKKETYKKIEIDYKNAIKLLNCYDYRDLSNTKIDLEKKKKHAV